MFYIYSEQSGGPKTDHIQEKRGWSSVFDLVCQNGRCIRSDYRNVLISGRDFFCLCRAKYLPPTIPIGATFESAAVAKWKRRRNGRAWANHSFVDITPVSLLCTAHEHCGRDSC